MMKLLTAYSMYFNTKYKRSGPLLCILFEPNMFKVRLNIYGYSHIFI